MLITQDDIQHIDNEETLLHFLEEKLNLPIPKGSALEDITIKFGKLALGLTGAVANQVLDCQELIVSPRQPSGIFLIRFNSESGYAETLRTFAGNLDRQVRNPADLRFICMNEYFRPFAIANFKDSGSKDWQTAVLNILAWTQENMHIYTSSEHELPANFFGQESTDESEYHPKDKTQINEFSVIESSSSQDLSTKLEDIGTRLGILENIYSGVTTGCDKALLIDEGTRKRLIDKDPNSRGLIKLSLRIKQKWTCQSKYLIYILSSPTKNKHIKQWPWSNARNESAAEHIFEETYPAIYAHLSRYTNELKNKKVGGKFFWEMQSSKLYSMSKRPKIIYPLYPTSMQAAYGEGIPTSSFKIIPTEDLSLLAILNSNCFQWYAKNNYPKSPSNQLSLKNGNMKNAPIAPRTEEEKKELSDLVQQILDAPNSPNVRNLEEEINMLVYDLYELTPAEIAFIEKGSNQ